MAAILDLAEVRERVARWSVEDYEHLVEQGLAPKRGELIRGIIIDKMSKSPLHCKLAKRLYDRFFSLGLEGLVVFQERGLRLADSEPEPDIAVARGVESDFNASHPSTAELVVEVAVSSVAADREYASLYAEAGVPEYWIVLAEAGQVEVRRGPVDGAYRELQIYGAGDTLVCRNVPGLTVVVAEFFG